jgi:transposase
MSAKVIIMSDPINNYTMIGVDVAKLKLDIAIDDKTVLTIDNQEESFKKLLKNIPNIHQVCFVMEATGGYERKRVNFLQSKEIAVAVVNTHRAQVQSESEIMLIPWGRMLKMTALTHK